MNTLIFFIFYCNVFSFIDFNIIIKNLINFIQFIIIIVILEFIAFLINYYYNNNING